MGYILRINELGDSEGNYSLVARDRLQDDPEQFGIYPVGVFRLNDDLTALPVGRFIVSISRSEDIHSGILRRLEPCWMYDQSYF